MKKIIFCSYNLDIGGIERAILNYIKNIDNEKYDIYLLLDRYEGIYLNEVPNYIHILKFNRSENKNVIIRKIINFSKILYFSIRYYHYFDFSACFATVRKSGILLAKRMSKNNAIWIHGTLYNTKEEADKFKKYTCLKKYKKIVFVSNKLKEDYIKYINYPKQLYVLNNMIDYENILNKSKEKIDLKKDKITFLHVGRHLEKDKNITMLLDCVNKLNKNYDFNLWLVGEGEDTNMYKEIVKKLKLKNVTFFGKQSNVSPYYKLCDAVVLSSNCEGNPVIYLESKVMNKPVISTNISDAKIELEGYGIVCENNFNDFYNSMKYFLDNGYKIKNKFNGKKYNDEILDKLYKIMEE